MAFDVSENLVGMVHVPLNELLCMPANAREGIGLPCLRRDDWTKAMKLSGTSVMPCVAGFSGVSVKHADHEAVMETTKSLSCAKSLSFYGWLSERCFNEAREFAGFGIRRLLFNCGGYPRQGMYSREPVSYWVLRVLSGEIRSACRSSDGVRIGLRIPGCNDWCVDIACRSGFDFIVVDFEEGDAFEQFIGWTLRRMNHLYCDKGTCPLLYLGMKPSSLSTNIGAYDRIYMDGMFLSFDDELCGDISETVSNIAEYGSVDIMETSSGDAMDDMRCGASTIVLSNRFRTDMHPCGSIDRNAVACYVKEIGVIGR